MSIVLVSRTEIKRFNQFKAALSRETGDRCTLAFNGEVIVHRNEFTPERRYRSIQQAIDNFSHLPLEL